MDYSISEAGKLSGRSSDTIRRAIRAGKLTATKRPNEGYRVNDSDLEAWAGRPTQSADLSNELDAARVTIEAQAAALDTASRDLDTLRELLTRERQIADAALEAQRVITAALGALTHRLEALGTGKPRRSWLKSKPTDT